MAKLTRILGFTILLMAVLLDAIACLYWYQRHTESPHHGSVESQQTFTDYCPVVQPHVQVF
jgi:hypothetical protein